MGNMKKVKEMTPEEIEDYIESMKRLNPETYYLEKRIEEKKEKIRKEYK